MDPNQIGNFVDIDDFVDIDQPINNTEFSFSDVTDDFVDVPTHEFSLSNVKEQFGKGLHQGVSGEISQLISGYDTTQGIDNDDKFWEKGLQIAGEFGSDLPYILAGTQMGASAGATIGSVGGGFGRAAGAVVGGGAGGLAFPAFLKQSLREYKDYVQKGNDLTFREFLERADRIASETLRSGAFGAILSIIGPLLSKATGNKIIDNLLNTRLGKKAAEVTAETAVFSSIPAIAEGRLPTVKDLEDAITAVGTFQVIKAVPAMKDAVMKLTESPERTRILKVFDDLEKAGLSKNVEKSVREALSDQIQSKQEDLIEPTIPKDEFKIIDAEEVKSSSDNEIKQTDVQQKFDQDILKSTPTMSDGSKRIDDDLPDSSNKVLSGKYDNVPKNIQIIKVLSDVYKDTPFRLGKQKKVTMSTAKEGAAHGYFSPQQNVIRLRDAQQISTAAHEFGHALQFVIYRNGKESAQLTRSRIRKAMEPYMDELTELGNYEPYELEGFAEFTRGWISDRDWMVKTAPKLTNYFETTVKNDFPDAYKALEESRKLYDELYKATPAEKVYARVISGFDRKPWQDKVDATKKAFNLDRIKTLWLDDLFPIKRAVADIFGITPNQVEDLRDRNNAYVQARTMKGWVGKAETFINDETFDPNSLEKTGKSLKSVLEPIRTDLERKELTSYLVAKRAQELEDRGINSGIIPKDSTDTIKALEKKYAPIADELYKYQDRVLNYALQSGLISQTQFKQVKDLNKFYVPFQRVFDESERSSGPMRGGKKLQANQVTKRIKGSSRAIKDPLESIINNTFYVIQNSERNLLGKTLARLASYQGAGKYMEKVPAKNVIKSKQNTMKVLEELGIDKFIPEEKLAELPEFLMQFDEKSWNPQENIITVFADGKPSYYETTKEIAELYKGGMSPYEGSWYVRGLSIPARSLRAGAILNPKFLMKNAIRDTLGGAVYTSDPKGIIDSIYQPFQGLAHSIKKDDLYLDWMKSGGGMSTMQSIDKSVESLKRQFGKKTAGKMTPFYWMRRAGEISEEMNRLAEYGKTLKGSKRWEKEFAAFKSRDLSIDFAKAGAYAKSLNMMIPFWNATIQGGDKFIRTMSSSPEKRNQFVRRAFMGVAVPMLIMHALNKDDKEINELPDYVRDANFIYRNPVSGELNKIPLPFEMGVIFGATSRRFFDYIDKRDPHAFDGLLSSIEDNALPNFVPTAFLPFFETWANKDMFREMEIVPKSQQGLVSSEQYNNYTSETAKKIAYGMRLMPGVDEFSKLGSPEIIDHFIRSWSAGVGDLTLKTIDLALPKEDRIEAPETSILSKIGLDVFQQHAPGGSSKSIRRFYDTYDKWKKIDASIEHTRKRGDSERAKQLALSQVAPDKMKLWYIPVQRMQTAINEVSRNRNLSGKDKRELMDKLYVSMAEYTKRVNDENDKWIERKKR